MMRKLFAVLPVAVLVGGMVGCAPQVRVVEVVVTVAPQVNVVQVTATPSPTSPPPPTPAPTTVTVCADGCDFTTIQAAVDAPITIAGGVIVVADTVHTEGDITVDKDVTIQGQGAGSTIVQAHDVAESSTDRVFRVQVGATVTIRDMTIQHGHPDLDPRIGGIRRGGGGILNQGALMLDSSIVRDNIGNSGGAILNTGTLTVTNCILRDNVADGIGEPGHQCGSGGGIMNVGQATLWMVNGTISGNSAFGKGGGIKSGCAGRTTVINSTISGNSANVRGGGIHAFGEVWLVNCTISGNNAVGLGQGRMEAIGNGGGGVYIQEGTFYYTNTIITDNTIGPSSVITGDCVVGENGVIAANANNLVADGRCEAEFAGDPMLGPLTSGEGGTLVHPLLPGSPAIDVIPAAECVVDADQRGVSRPQKVGCDIGAYELEDE